MRGAAALIAVFAACASAPPLVVDIAAFNDFHGNIEPPAEPWSTAQGPVPAGGAAYLGAHLAALRTRRPELIIASAGDMIGASPLASALLHDEPTIEVMNAIGVHFNAVGNHELDEGVGELERLVGGGCHAKDGCQGLDPWPGARFVTSAANLLREGTSAPVFPGSWVRAIEGVKIGFIGLVLSSTPEHQPAWFGGARFLPEATAANEEARKLRAQGVEALIVVVHEGLVSQGDMNACDAPTGDLLPILRELDPAIDAVISGHTHRAYVCTIAGRTVTSAGSYGRVYTHLQLTIDRARGDVLRVEAKNHVVDHALPPDPAVLAIVDRHVASARITGDRVVGRVTADIPRRADAGGTSPLGMLVADAHLFATRSAGAEIAIVHGRGLRTEITLARSGPEQEEGVVRFAEIAAVHPFGNHLMTVTVTGAELLAFLEESYAGEAEPRFLIPSAELSWEWSAAASPRIGAVKVRGVALDLAKDYRLTINDYLAGRGALANARDTNRGMTDADGLTAYFEKFSPISPPDGARVTPGPRVRE